MDLWKSDGEFADRLDRLNPDLTLDLERTLHFLLSRPLDEEAMDAEVQLRRLKAILIRQYRYGKGHGFEGAMDAIRKGRR